MAAYQLVDSSPPFRTGRLRRTGFRRVGFQMTLKIDADAVPTAAELLAEGVLEIHATKGGRTVILAVKVAKATAVHSPEWPGYYMEVEISGAGFSGSIDERLNRQANSIERLMGHLKTHCPEFIDVPTSCPFMEDMRNGK